MKPPRARYAVLLVLCAVALAVGIVQYFEPQVEKQSDLTIVTKFAEVRSGPNAEELSFDWVQNPIEESER